MMTLAKNPIWFVILLALASVTLNATARDLSGIWWDPNQSGTGVALLQEGDLVSGSWYFYDDGGIDTWFTFGGTLANESLTTDLLRFSGPNLGSSFDPIQVQASVAGTVTLNIRGPGMINFDYSITATTNPPATGLLSLVPFAVTVSDTERLAEFAGFYTGRFTDNAGAFGSGNGIFAVVADNFGKVAGVQIFAFSGRSCASSGTISSNGEATLRADCGTGAEGATATGTITSNGILSGTWVSDTGLSSGSISGSRQDTVALNTNVHDLSGIWWDPDQSGTGVALLRENDLVSGAWYFYDEGGFDTWFTFGGTLANDSLTTDLLRFTGPALGSPFDPTQVQTSVAGTVTLSVRGAAIDFDYSIARMMNPAATGRLNLVPFAVTVSDTERLAALAGFYSGEFTDDAGIFAPGNGLFTVIIDKLWSTSGPCGVFVSQ